VISASPAATEACAAALAPALLPGDVLALEGPLGGGKTRFVHGLARGLGARGRVRSPTFTLVLEYHGRIPLFHLDLYRLDSGADPGLGLEEMAERGVLAVEWGEKLPPSWLAEALTIRFALAGETTRELSAAATAGRGLDLLAAWRAVESVEAE
jgi:tRNA threonylcarbamoyladenosine biosynthesis protein TsaE